jgi:hypothetical protein
MNFPGRILKRGVLQFVTQSSGLMMNKADILNNRGHLHSIFPPDFTGNEEGDIGFIQPFTVIGMEMMIGLSRGLDWLVNSRTGEDIVERGVWTGGSMMLIANWLLRAGGKTKNLFPFDTI